MMSSYYKRRTKGLDSLGTILTELSHSINNDPQVDAARFAQRLDDTAGQIKVVLEELDEAIAELRTATPDTLEEIKYDLYGVIDQLGKRV